MTYLGGYNLHYTVTPLDGGKARIDFEVRNFSTIESATHPPVVGYTKWWREHIGEPLNRTFSSGPMSKTEQTFRWSEEVTYK